MEMTESKKICKWFLNGAGRCSLNGSRCDYPFSKTGCEIQCARIFKEKPEGEKADRYVPDNNPIEKLTKAGIFKELGLINSGNVVGDWFIPYENLFSFLDISMAISRGIEMVQEKFDEAECQLQTIKIYHNVEFADGMIGIYIFGIG